MYVYYFKLDGNIPVLSGALAPGFGTLKNTIALLGY